MYLKRLLSAAMLVVTLNFAAAQVANGKLQIHHVDIGQGDGGILISPSGTVVLFDVGRDIAKQKTCSSEIDYMDQLGIQKVDYIFVSHYHDDHIGCIPEVLAKFPLQHEPYDRGGQPTNMTAVFKNYVAAVGTHRKTVVLDQVITLESGRTSVSAKAIALNGAYKDGEVNAKDENDVSMSILVSFADFREEIGGDLSGEKTGMYVDVETGAETEAGPLDVYKLHHHCSSHSSNENWLSATKPTVAIISTGLKNTYHHPASDCIQRLHNAEIAGVYWTEVGNGEAPKQDDIIGGDIVVEVPASGGIFTISHNDGELDTYHTKSRPAPVHGEFTSSENTGSSSKFAWSIKSKLYHEADCPAVNRISKANLQSGDNPPAGKTLSSCHKN